MAEKHESCFVCKRSNPDRHVYYKDYAELEGQNPQWSCSTFVIVISLPWTLQSATTCMKDTPASGPVTL